VYGKGQKERTVPFLQPAQKATLRWMMVRDSDRPELWLTDDGTPMTHNALGLDLRRMFDRAGLQNVRDVCHVFRRTFAANAERQGIPRPYIQAICGWEDSQMLDRYVAAMQAEGQAIQEFKEKFKPFGG